MNEPRRLGSELPLIQINVVSGATFLAKFLKLRFDGPSL